jgi:hypothetical protein
MKMAQSHDTYFSSRNSSLEAVAPSAVALNQEKPAIMTNPRSGNVIGHLVGQDTFLR